MASRHCRPGVGDQLFDCLALEEIEVADAVAHRAAQQVPHGAAHSLPLKVKASHVEPAHQLVGVARHVPAEHQEIGLVGLRHDPLRIEHRLPNEMPAELSQDDGLRPGIGRCRGFADTYGTVFAHHFDQVDEERLLHALRPDVRCLQRQRQRGDTDIGDSHFSHPDGKSGNSAKCMRGQF